MPDAFASSEAMMPVASLDLLLPSFSIGVLLPMATMPVASLVFLLSFLHRHVFATAFLLHYTP